MSPKRKSEASGVNRMKCAVCILAVQFLCDCVQAFMPIVDKGAPHRLQSARVCHYTSPRVLRAINHSTDSIGASASPTSAAVESSPAAIPLKPLAKEAPVLQRPLLQRVYNTFRWRDWNINYRVEGQQGPSLLLIHGFGASINHFRNQFQSFPDLGHQVYALDLLGFGASDKPSSVETFSLELWRDLLLDFMQAMESKGAAAKWTVMGNSIGGLLTLMVAKARPQSVAGVVLFNSAGGLTSFREEELPWYLRPIWHFFRNVVFGDAYGPRFFSRFRTEQNVRSVLNQVYFNKTAVDDELVQTLLLPGQDEGAEQGVRFPLYNKNIKLHGLPQTGHCPHDERPQEVYDLVKPFLADVYGKT